MFGMPQGWSELVTFVVQPIHLPILCGVGVMGFFVWRSLRHG